tara:strand:+ start:214 stop:732 length:519 start_codon:yes stop_codon:yes gene_type:complete
MNPHKKSPTRAGGIIFDKHTQFILLVLNRESYYKNENKWGLPKGHLTNVERHYPHIGAQREIMEETGIYFPITENTFSISIYDTKYYVATLCKNSNPFFFPKDKTEIIHACWFPVNRISELNVNRTLSKLILKWKNIFPDIYKKDTISSTENNILKKILYLDNKEKNDVSTT